MISATSIIDDLNSRERLRSIATLGDPGYLPREARNPLDPDLSTCFSTLSTSLFMIIQSSSHLFTHSENAQVTKPLEAL